MDLGRVTKELQEIRKDTKSGVKVELPDEKNLRKLKGFVEGKFDASIFEYQVLVD